MVAEVVSQSLNAAQVFFLIALICGGIATVVALVTNPPTIWAAMLAACATFVAVGLLFFA